MRTHSTAYLVIASSLALAACNQSIGESAGGSGAPSFDAPRAYEVAGKAYIADVDGDGDLDVIIPERYSETDVAILYNRGDGSFDLNKDVTQIDLELVADVNGDGLADLVGPDFVFPGQLEVKLAKADDTFSRATTPVKEDLLWPTLLAADLDGDGYPEIMNVRSDETVAYFLDGAGNVTSTSVLAKSEIRPTPDLDGDGRAELYGVVGGRLNVTSSKTKSSWSASLGSYDASVVKFVDVDRDGVTDIFVAAFESGRKALHALTFKGNGDGTFATNGNDVLIGSNAMFDDLIDIDSDGTLDIAYRDPDLMVVELFATGDGAFGFGTSSYAVALPDDAGSVQFADFTGDGRADMLVMTQYVTYIVPSL